MSAKGQARAAARDRVLLIGSRDTHKALVDDLQMGPEHPATVVAFVEPEEIRPGRDAVAAIAEANRVAVVVLDRGALSDETVVSQVANVHLAGLRVRSLSLFYEEWLAKLPIAELERTALMFDISEVHRSRYQRMKRIFDLAVATVGLIPLAMSWPIVAAVNRLAYQIPSTYRQSRVGKNGLEFEIVKYRTMRTTNEGGEDVWTEQSDPRVTSFGRFLRRAHIDELPQVLNILRGHISIVGPRPEQPHYVTALIRVLPFYSLRSIVMPGVTGWAQVKFGYAGNERDALQKLQYDFYYLRHQGLRMDIVVLGRTIRNILGLRGR
jgi:lipopolysaccharide/colanic/teichoic acid biosynthesis glycosyltransferase